MKDKRIKKGDQVRATRDLLAEDRILIKKGCHGQVLGWMQYSWKVRWFGHNGMPIGWHLPPDIMLEKDYPKRSSKDRDLATRLHGVLAVLDRGAGGPGSHLPSGVARAHGGCVVLDLEP